MLAPSDGSVLPGACVMVDVTNKTFEAVLPQIISEVRAATFLALDAEFTGLLANAAYKADLFDDGPRRYRKLCASMHHFSITQLGLAVFTGEVDSNSYSVSTYNFYLRPHSCASSDPIIACQTSSLEFLQRFNFDFNKWIYEGVPYMNSEEEENLQTELSALFKGTKPVLLSFELTDHLRAVGEWVAMGCEGGTHTVAGVLDTHSQAMLLAAIHNTFAGLWATLQDGQIVVRSVSSDERERLDTEDPGRTQLVSALVERNAGFTRLFRHLVELRKPIVLHNCILDLMLMYKQFHKRLPSSYSTFKSEVHALFPLLYDTKFVAEEMRSKYRDDAIVSKILHKTSLGELHTALRGDLPVLYVPRLHHSPPDNKYSKDDVMLHEAGYDAILTGTCFVRMAQLCAMISLPVTAPHRPLSPREHLFTLKEYANKIQVPRSAVSCMVLSGEDRPSKRPPWLLVEGQGRGVRVTPGLVSATLAKYGRLDVQPLNNKSVLVATTSWNCLTNILSSLSSETSLQAKIYSRPRLSPLMHTFILSGAVLSTGLGAWLVYKSFKKSSS